jgi:malic enzyme
MYLGSRHPRLPDEEYYALWNEFLLAVWDKWPHSIVQFEDISNDHCFELLARYRNRLRCFNDDIQGTGAVVAAGFMSASRLSKISPDDQKILFLGAGSAAVGVADQIVRLIAVQSGKSIDQCRDIVYFVDSAGLVTNDRREAS